MFADVETDRDVDVDVTQGQRQPLTTAAYTTELGNSVEKYSI